MVDEDNLPNRMTPQAVAEVLCVTRQHVYNLLKEGLIDAMTVSCSGSSSRYSIRVSGKSVTRFIHSRKFNPGQNL